MPQKVLRRPLMERNTTDLTTNQTNQAKILIVEDEEQLARFIELELSHEGYEVTKAYNGRDGLDIALKNNFDLVLLDIMLPGLNGLEVLRRLQKDHPTPTSLLTARDAVKDRVSGLDAGAVDYITKPFAIEELLARIRVALRLHPMMDASAASGTAANGTGGAGNGDEAGTQSGAARAAEEAAGIYRWQTLTLDDPQHLVTCGGQSVTLTNREYLMLKTLLQNRDIVMSRDVLLEKVCGYDYVGETNVVDVYIRYLRSKIDEAFHIKMIETVRGVGYVIRGN